MRRRSRPPEKTDPSEGKKNKAPRPIGRERKYPGKAYTKVARQKYKDKPKEKQQRGKTAAEGHHRTTGRREGCRRGTLGRMWPHGKHYFNPWGWKSGRRSGCPPCASRPRCFLGWGGLGHWPAEMDRMCHIPCCRSWRRPTMHALRAETPCWSGPIHLMDFRRLCVGGYQVFMVCFVVFGYCSSLSSTP